MLPFAAARSTCLSVFALVLPARQCYLARQPARLSSLPYLPSLRCPVPHKRGRGEEGLPAGRVRRQNQPHPLPHTPYHQPSLPMPLPVPMSFARSLALALRPSFLLLPSYPHMLLP